MDEYVDTDNAVEAAILLLEANNYTVIKTEARELELLRVSEEGYREGWRGAIRCLQRNEY